MTAIAAVLAFSSTSLAAQEATSTDVPLVTVPAPEPVAPAADPLAPTPAAETSATQAAEVSEPAKTAPAAKPVAKKAAAKAERSTARTAAKAVAPVPAAAPVAAVPEVTAPAATPLVDARPTTDPAPVEQAEAAPKIDEAIPLAGGAGAVILALAGARMAIRRRKRTEEEEGELQEETVLTDEVTPAPAPEPWNPPVVEPTVAPIAVTRTDLPENFETSHFGRHVQAAYAGPTPENPSLSLRKRLKLAGELDRRERMAGTAPTEAPKAAKPAQQPTGFMLSDTASPARTPEYQF